MNMIWDGDIKPGNKKEIEGMLSPLLWLVPGWLQTLRIGVYTTENSESLACMQAKEQYREASLTVRPLWFTESDAVKRTTLVHELLHIHTNPLYDFAANVIDKHIDDSPSRTVILNEMEACLERVTQDLTFAMEQKGF